ncbi:MAG: NmrA family NAD(P)-binding protein [Vicinamibacteria bacterium]|jgi:uncharacterized protein YbjT (DUF2867 family)|nr:NmrA family NAD(P)-binding protein [Vicinamibacteria bacterium]
MITIFGASGNTGGAAAAGLLKVGKKVRVVGRRPEKLDALVQAGAESAIGDIEDAAFVKRALAGVEAAYVLIPPNMATDDFRAYGRRVIAAVSEGIEATSVGHVVLLSSIGAHHSAGTGPIVMVHEFEERLKKIKGLNALFLRAGFFMQNVFMSMGAIKAQGIYGGPMPAAAAVPMIAAADIGAYAAGRLARLDFSGTSAVHLLGPQAVSGTELVTILGQAIGKPIRYVQLALDELEKGMLQGGLRPPIVSVFMEMYRGASQGLVAPEEGGKIETAPTTFETFTETVFAPAYRV